MAAALTPPGPNGTFAAMEIAPRISVTPGVCGGRPVITGTRVRVSDVLDMLASGASAAEIIADYSYLEAADIRAALAFAARAADHPVVIAPVVTAPGVIAAE